MLLSAYLRRVDKVVDLTPDDRNRVVDTLRVIALLVVTTGDVVPG